MFVPVVDKNQEPLMPTTPARARRWVRSGKATPFFKNGVFCVRLNMEPSDRETQPVVVGIDPGSKKEGFSVKSEAHTYLNIQADACTHVQRHVKERREMRRGRRFRKTPCRKPRSNRSKGGLPPSTKARWDWKLRVCRFLRRIFPITHWAVEDVSAHTRKGSRKWNSTFSPLEVGKRWFYDELRKLGGELCVFSGRETKQERDRLGLKKVSRKTAETFWVHCVDAWVLARKVVGGAEKPDNLRLFCVAPVILHRRQLHRRQPSKGGVRLPYGGTRSHGFKRGSLVKHPKRGVTYVGGVLGDRVSLHGPGTGKRLCQNARPQDLRFLSWNTWKTRLLPVVNDGVSGA